MLKIKEDKMQELEKFGFEKHKSIYGGYIYTYNICNNHESCVVMYVMKDRKILFGVNCDEIWTDELDILYELFANDMIEKEKE